MSSHAALMTGFLLLLLLLMSLQRASVHSASVDVDREFDELKKLLKTFETNLESAKTKVSNKVGENERTNYHGRLLDGKRSGRGAAPKSSIESEECGSKLLSPSRSLQNATWHKLHSIKL
jgi:hypothetical protein